ncbi:lytic murein transglycosylase B [Neptunomonas qingdaonensis]|uniref:Membrane-bound lytic murein transglycosylase B n=1 Tax=Neptunomonas qingdaonensis TaxID=1045558 RepID=A0A1I2NB02_9GAMM|nr:lytic murein transglycosylase B [Neptunomonas qingdaonensis]SFG01085.1 membrane-bound lytic murein transglycosylase B [Neptunomonas qingdaonensis]
MKLSGKRKIGLLALMFSCFVQGNETGGYSQHPEAEKWLEKMQAEAFSADYLRSILAHAEKKDSILNAMNRPAEKRLDWGGYRKLFVQPKRITRGVDFWNEHAETLQRAEQVYGVPAEIIVSIIGIETHYGRNVGSYRALDALATLGFDYPRRAEFFQEQLKDLLILARDENREVVDLKSSYAGAMGYGQFMPSSFLAYAVDFDRDGKRDLWSNPVDAIGSVANYFVQHGWQPQGETVIEVRLKGTVPEADLNTGERPKRLVSEWAAFGVKIDQSYPQEQAAVLLRMKDKEVESFWLGLNNYYVITRYNRSRLYAMAVYELSQAIVAEKVAIHAAEKRLGVKG